MASEQSMGTAGQPAMMGSPPSPPAPSSMGASAEQSMVAPMMGHEANGVGHLYMQTNEIRNCIIHYHRSADGTIAEAERYFTGGSGSGGYNPIVHRESTPNPFEGAYSVILSPDHRFLFTTNAGDNSVSSFAVSEDGHLTLVDAKRTGNVVPDRSGSAKALAYNSATGTLYVCHALGPDHIRLMSVDSEGRLTARAERYTVNLPDKPNRVATMAALSPDARFLVVGTTFDEPAKPNPDGSPILWVSHNGDAPHSVASNAPDPDGLVVFPVNGEHGALGEPLFQDGGGASPWNPLFLNHRPNQFILGYAVADGVSLATLDSDGKVTTGPVVKIDTSAGLPSELCWLSISPDDRTVFATHFGYSYITTYRLEGNVLSVAKDPACPKVPGNGAFRALNGTVSSGPSDNWLSPDGVYLYQIYGNASKLIGYRVEDDASLTEVTSAEIPYNSCQGLAGF
jgi:6-phosphogluconolactonase (cycloisomerase 2 family)